MLRSRVIPCLLVHDGGLVKTEKFSSAKYVGDPLNAVRIFNEKKVDELVVLDIDATVAGRGPDLDLVAKLTKECRMPLCFGGGVSTVEDGLNIVSLGVEKVALSHAAISNPGIITDMAAAIGSQSVVVIVDVKKTGLLGRYSIVTHNGQTKWPVELSEYVSRLENLGAGEVVVNSVDRDGTMSGYDMKLIDQVREATSLPLTALGGAASLDDIRALVERHRIIGAAAGSLFVFKGPYKAVLISYQNLG